MARYFFLYGRYYDLDKEKSPVLGEGPIVVYLDSKTERQLSIGSLEGVFLSLKENPFNEAKGNPICRRDEMDAFAEKYNGRFFLFDELTELSTIIPQIFGEESELLLD